MHQRSAYDQLYKTTYSLVAASSGIQDEKILSAQVHRFLDHQLKKSSPTDLLKRVRTKAGRTILLGMFLGTLSTTSVLAVTPTFAEKTGANNPFTATISNYGNNEPAIALGDLDGDGDLDLVASSGSYAAEVLFNTGSSLAPAFSTRVSNTAAFTNYNMFPAGYGDLVLKDMDGDGDLDAIATRNVLGLRYLVNGGTITAPLFPSSNIATGLLTALPFYAAGVADFDGDGDFDIIARQNNILKLFTNTAGVFASSTYTSMTALSSALNTLTGYSWGGGVVNMEAADFDGDGDADLLINVVNAADYSGALYYVENTGTINAPNFVVDTTPLMTFPAGSYLNSVTSGDLDGDGDMDFVFSKVDIILGAPQQVSLRYFTNGPANTAPTAPTLLSPAPGAVVMGGSVTLQWGAATDAEMDPLTYTANLCQDAGMTVGCQNQNVFGATLALNGTQPPQAQLPWQNVAIAAQNGELPATQSTFGWWMLALFGLLAGTAMTKYKRKHWLYAMILIVFGVASCEAPPVGGNGGGGGNGLSATFTGLTPGVYYWQVSVSDGTNTTTTSVQSFTIQ